MECNKDEAVRAKRIAEEKMTSNDFEGARKVALKAQNLYPELENIKQLLSVCDVHCSAQKRLGSEKDWYGILQVERFADESTIKKQYRRLALYLHPDKNAFPGAEAAFKLICEAHVVLSDPTKKALFDSKIRATAGFASVNLPPHHLSRNSQFNKQHGPGYHMNFPNDFSGLHQPQAAEPSFWTSCPFCSTKYQYQRKYVNSVLRCPKCLKSFMAYETSAHSGVSMGSTWVPPPTQVPLNPGGNQSAVFQEREAPGQNKFTMGTRGVKAFSTSKVEYMQSPKKKTGEKVNSNVNNREQGNRKRRGRKQVVESSESCDSSSSDSNGTINDSFDNHKSTGPSHVHFPRRSTRRRQNVSYHEGDDDDDDDDYLPDQVNKLSEDNGKQQESFSGEDSKHNNQNSGEIGTARPEESLKEENADRDKEVKDIGMSKTDVDPIEIESDSDRDISIACPVNIDCPDPEFSDFDKNRNIRCFAVNQLWACYDDVDSMPRFYAKVKKVQLSPIEITITWLEPDPIDEPYKQWWGVHLPVACGCFKLGSTDKVSGLLSFSRQVRCQEGKKRNQRIIYPRSGEVWALFKDCDLSWISNPKDHREYKYEIVEVLTEFDASCGIKVRFLNKVTGFVSLFVSDCQSEASSFLVGPNELYKFSHSIPYDTMTGTEREGVPVGAFELDPASLPLNRDDLRCTGN